MASAEGGSVPNGVRYGEVCHLSSSRLGGLGSVGSSPSGVRGYFEYFEGHGTLLFVPI